MREMVGHDCCSVLIMAIFDFFCVFVGFLIKFFTFQKSTAAKHSRSVRVPSVGISRFLRGLFGRCSGCE
jgi:hypothetical protein